MDLSIMKAGRTARSRLPGSGDATLALLVLLVCSVLLYAQVPGFFRRANLISEFRSLLPLLCLAVGQMVVICARGIDLSAGPLLTLSSVVMVMMFGTEPNGMTAGIAILAGLVVGIAGGAVNGGLVAIFRLQPVVATFATSFIWAGLALWVLPQPGGEVPAWLRAMVRLKTTIPPVLVVLAVMAVIWLAFIRSRGYRKLLAVGGDPVAAQTTGIPVRGIQFGTYVFSGFMAGIGAFLLCADIASGDPLVGNALTLPAIVAVVIGGTRLTGGNATFIGTLAGALVMVVLRSNVFAAGLPFTWQPLVDGALVVLVLGIAGILRKLKGE